MQNIDLNTIDNIGNLVIQPENLIDPEEVEDIRKQIERQYIDLENLGIDLLTSKPFQIKREILPDVIQYVDQNYTSVVDISNCLMSPVKLIDVGEKVYKFICVDFFNSILPNYISIINCSCLEDFELFLKNKYKYDYTLVKADLIKVIKDIVIKLSNLKKLDNSIIKNPNYNELLLRYTYYLELVDFGETQRFVENYIIPMLSKNFGQILWRTF